MKNHSQFWCVIRILIFQFFLFKFFFIFIPLQKWIKAKARNKLDVQDDMRLDSFKKERETWPRQVTTPSHIRCLVNYSKGVHV